ncbi:MAG: hypothetical protein M3458_00055 [Acidobacteriota bacterium]|nr:hypothetical protein [Acidobacteriota bacterium]
MTTNPDGSTTETSYSGCGCVGSEQVTTRDERGRRKRYSKDTLGRLVRTEELNWDTSVYATAYQSYNARDQLTQINHQGQLRTMEYDGHGRLSRRTTPEQGATTYAYNLDDTLSQTVDARGASSTYSYNGRHLVTGISYGVPAGVAATPNVSFGYDSAGNRTSMTDGLGSVTYSYNTLSRLQWEERTFTGVGTFRLSYTYNLAGQLTSMTNPWGVQVGYQYDHTGLLRGVTGAGYGGVTSYASNLQYRASGAIKALTYGNGRQLSMSYDTRQRLSRWHVAGVTGSDYAYNYAGWPVSENTGRVVFADNLYDNTLDRSYEYDQVGRLIVAHTGVEARTHNTGQSQSGALGPYSQHYGYDQWGNINYRAGWGGWHPSYSITHVNNQVQVGRRYDAAGHFIDDLWGNIFQYDATGQQIGRAHLIS